VSELCSLIWGDVVLAGRRMSLAVRSSRGARQRQVPLNQGAREALEALRPDHVDDKTAVFLGQRGPLTPRGVQELVARHARAAELKGISPQSLRHSFCKDLADAGVGLETIAALAGHETVESTRRYRRSTPVDLARVVQCLEER